MVNGTDEYDWVVAGKDDFKDRDGNLIADYVDSVRRDQVELPRNALNRPARLDEPFGELSRQASTLYEHLFEIDGHARRLENAPGDRFDDIMPACTLLSEFTPTFRDKSRRFDVSWHQHKNERMENAGYSDLLIEDLQEKQRDLLGLVEYRCELQTQLFEKLKKLGWESFAR